MNHAQKPARPGPQEQRMSRMATLSALFLLPLIAGTSDNQSLSRYKAIETYEIRPGIVIMPRYTSGHEVCEVGIERRHYSPEIIRLNSDLSRKEVDQIVDDLAPPSDRGPAANIGKIGNELMSQEGNSFATSIDYQNVTVQIYGPATEPDSGDVVIENIVATIRWKNRKCS
jgi:hypothetical protein